MSWPDTAYLVYLITLGKLEADVGENMCSMNMEGVWFHFLFLQGYKKEQRIDYFQSKLSSESHTMAGLCHAFKATMEFKKGIIIQDELEQNHPSINEQRTSQQQVDIILIIPHSLSSSEQKYITRGCKLWGEWHKTWLSNVNSCRTMYRKLGYGQRRLKKSW